MVRRHLLYLLYTSYSRPPSSPPPYFTAPQPLLFCQGCCRGSHMDKTINHERAPSTLEEFKRLEEEKAGQRVGNQTVEKGKDANIMEAVAKEIADVGKTSKAGESQSTK